MPANRAEAERLFFEGTDALNKSDAALAGQRLRQAIAIAPDLAEAHANLALVLEAENLPAEAEASYRTSIALDPGIARTHLNLGSLLAAQKRFRDAETFYSQAIMLDSRSAAAWSNLGVLYACMKRESEAEQCYRTAMGLDTQYATAPFNLSYLLLRQGRFEEGWACFEQRDWYRALAQRLHCPRWQGESLVGKSLLIGYEAGHGDMIHFGRYAQVLRQQGAAHITMLCHPALTRLFATLDGVDQAVSFKAPIEADSFDYWVPLLSIPFHCGTRLESIPARLPYLHVSAEEKQKWAARLSAETNDRLRVGLVWKGNPDFENDADRSLPSLNVLAPLGAADAVRDRVRFFSLQKGAGEDEALHPSAGLSPLPLGATIDDFADTAAIIDNLDLVISVDTGVAHLVGALSKPCWVLLPAYKTDWRWLTDRGDSPWYPGVMRLFRQAQAGQWKQVIDEVAAELVLFAETHRRQ